MKLDKKGQAGFDIRGILNILLVVGISLVVVALVLAFAAQVGEDVRPELGTTGENLTRDIINQSNEGMQNLSAQMTSIGTIGGAIVIIGMVLLIARFAGV